MKPKTSRNQKVIDSFQNTLTQSKLTSTMYSEKPFDQSRRLSATWAADSQFDFKSQNDHQEKPRATKVTKKVIKTKY